MLSHSFLELLGLPMNKSRGRRSSRKLWKSMTRTFSTEFTFRSHHNKYTQKEGEEEEEEKKGSYHKRGNVRRDMVKN